MVRKERNIIMEMEFHSLSAEHCLLRSMVVIVCVDYWIMCEGGIGWDGFL